LRAASTNTILFPVDAISDDVSHIVLTPISWSKDDGGLETGRSLAIWAFIADLCKVSFNGLNEGILSLLARIAHVKIKGLLEYFANYTITEEDVDLERD